MSRQNPLLHIRVSKKQQKSIIDKLATAASFIYPLTGLPQAVEVLYGSHEGVSLVSWVGFAIFSCIFLSYGLFYKIRPMIITNMLWLIVDILVIAGVLLGS